ncbi:molybdopterin synthase sulfur carrier subunit-like isoform X2 [Melanaphis sacchari]|uniref:molybdopterin synthase sulfur carrier subunit-like isoform X2 n=1 Tax=Melanaphis sacchari TaxID=742174 RepID=UPI000DC154FE|nr:molybdopterin synthase sulfur carrier subunit-like isoform X2 [Melanaphis sacchari]
MAYRLTSRLVFQILNDQTLNKRSLCFFKLPLKGLKLFIKVMTVVNVTIIFFAQARELSKLKSTTVQLPQTLFGHDLRSILVEQFNLLSIGNIFILAVNENYISDNLQITLKEKDIVAVIPPISGG